jgi:phenylalanyl-tRNA synthetase beta chain
MNISYNWLKDLIDISLSPDELALALTRVGLAVEGVHPHGDDFILDVDLTSNRPDCLSHLGVEARDDLRRQLRRPEEPEPGRRLAEGRMEGVTTSDHSHCNRSFLASLPVHMAKEVRHVTPVAITFLLAAALLLVCSLTRSAAML